MKTNNNQSQLVGTIVKTFVPIGESNYQPLYEGVVEIQRKNGGKDLLPVLCLEKNLPVYYCEGIKLHMTGAFRSFRVNKENEGNAKIALTLAMEKGVVMEEEEHDSSTTTLEGFVPLRKYFSDHVDEHDRTAIVLCVPRDDNNTDYIPCTAWDENASMLYSLPQGTKIRITGRYKNRTYLKQENNRMVEKTAQEIIIYDLAVI